MINCFLSDIFRKFFFQKTVVDLKNSVTFAAPKRDGLVGARVPLHAGFLMRERFRKKISEKGCRIKKQL
ncbi:MAG: hypothetical protein CML05_03185 [Pseudozobellia sp.]|nr:hypothetical protein [Pseudozobellia sp.]